jgi:hypothetical protein
MLLYSYILYFICTPFRINKSKKQITIVVFNIKCCYYNTSVCKMSFSFISVQRRKGSFGDLRNIFYTVTFLMGPPDGGAPVVPSKLTFECVHV